MRIEERKDEQLPSEEALVDVFPNVRVVVDEMGDVFIHFGGWKIGLQYNWGYIWLWCWEYAWVMNDNIYQIVR